MGFNTVHIVSGDYIKGYNITNNTYFKYSVVDKEALARFTLSTGLDLTQSTLQIMISSHANINVDDSLEIMGKKYIVIGIANVLGNPLVCRYRKDYADMTGSSVITLA